MLYLIYSAKHSAGSELAVFWRPKAAGYTTDLDQAGRYPKDEVDVICRNSHGENVPVAESAVLGISHRVAYINKVRALCPTCHGHGWNENKAQAPCPRCRGEGKVSKE
jgi:hypothetical protein